jgi:predicted ATPase
MPPTRLIGREVEVGRALELLQRGDVRALTLTGPAGVGKTRLALALGHALRFDFADGAAWVDLAPIGDAALVPSAVAQALGVRERAGKSLADALAVALRHSHLRSYWTTSSTFWKQPRWRRNCWAPAPASSS